VTGALNIALGVPVWMQLLHLLLADTLWITYVLASAQALQAPLEVAQPSPH
jgi:heme A synthase